jgi:O-antigen/teichoic acid export membrane protein
MTTTPHGVSRRVPLGLADQIVSALSNAAAILLPLVLLPDQQEAGAAILALTVAYVVLSVNRSFVGEVLLAHASRQDVTVRARLVRDGAAAALVVGIVAGLVMFGVSALWPDTGNLDLSQLIWVAPAMPFVVIQDTGRYAAFAARQPERALVLDSVWVIVQALLVTGLVMWGHPTGGTLLACWGAGAAAGAVCWLLRDRLSPLAGRPRRWLTETRHLSGWFATTAVLGQVQVQLVAFLVAGTLGTAAFARLRLAQTVVIAPVQNLMMAAMSLLVPRSSLLVAGGKMAELRRQTRKLTVAAVGLAVGVFVIVMLLAEPLLQVALPRYADAAPLRYPLSIQAGIYLIQIPYAAALRGMQAARLLLLQYVIFAIVSIGGLIVGAHAGGLFGAAWGLCVGAAAGLVTMMVLYRVAAAAHSSAAPVDQPAERV